MVLLGSVKRKSATCMGQMASLSDKFVLGLQNLYSNLPDVDEGGEVRLREAFM